MRKVVLPLVGVALLGSLVACAPTDIESVGSATEAPANVAPAAEDATDKAADKPASDTRQDLVVTEKTFGQNSYDPTTWWYVVILDNPNTDYVFDLASFTIEAVDGAGTILDSSSAFTTVLAGKTALTGSFMSVGSGTITDISLRGPDKAEATKSTAGQTGAFTLAPEAPVTDEYSTTVAGTLTGTFATEQSLVSVNIVARNGAGQIVGSTTTYVDRLPVGGTVRYESMFMDPMPADTTYEAYASL